jgi:hypothetical protein
MGYVFVSYSRKDNRKVRHVIEVLESHGFEFWQDTNSIRNGKNWPEEITKAIVGCSRFLLFMSTASMVSDNVKREVQIAYEENKNNIIILRLDNSKVSYSFKYQLAGIQRSDYPSSNWEAEIVSALGGKIKPPFAPATNTHKSTSFKDKPHTTKALLPRKVLSELEVVFSANGDYYKDECEAALLKLKALRINIGSHWIGRNNVYQEIVPKLHFLAKLESICDLIEGFKDASSPRSREKRLLILNELRSLLSELDQEQT